ncbi:hypothetical protein HJC99_04345 [Candidatus Saccharibacteria bacterium]|nr:hypothetical protein [Candidatus Saccharibacteria bacterium]
MTPSVKLDRAQYHMLAANIIYHVRRHIPVEAVHTISDFRDDIVEMRLRWKFRGGNKLQLIIQLSGDALIIELRDSRLISPRVYEWVVSQPETSGVVETLGCTRNGSLHGPQIDFRLDDELTARLPGHDPSLPSLLTSITDVTAHFVVHQAHLDQPADNDVQA